MLKPCPIRGYLGDKEITRDVVSWQEAGGAYLPQLADNKREMRTGFIGKRDLKGARGFGIGRRFLR